MRRLREILLASVTVLVGTGGASASPLCNPFATGGTVTLVQSGNQQFCVHRFTSVGSSVFTALRPLSVQYLVIGGGGGGGSSDLYDGINYHSGGGGGAGGVRQGTGMALTAGNFAVVVGAGGAGGASGGTARGLNGGNSSFNGQTGTGGGGGGGSTSQPAPVPPTSGGSGGGGGGRQSWTNDNATAGAAGTAGQGNRGGNGRNGSNGGTTGGNAAGQTGGGGGGAGGAGGAGQINLGGTGGAGITSTITGTAVDYAGGGGGGHRGTVGSGGNASAGGGAGRGQDQGGNGGSGVVILRYLANTAPDADAGPDQSVLSLSAVTLDGTGSSDPDDNIVTYAWTQTSGTPVTLDNPAAAQPGFTAPQPAGGAAADTLVFQLTVTDAFGLSSTDTVTISLQGVAVLVPSKAVTVFAEDGSQCSDLTAAPPDTGGLTPVAIPGACVQYVISLQNTGPVTAQGISLIDPLPGTLTLQAAGLGANWGVGTALSFSPGCSGASCGIEVTGGSIPANTTATITIRASVN